MDPATEAASVAQFQQYFEMAFPLLKGLTIGLITLIGGWILAKWAQRLTRTSAEKAKLDKALGGFFGNLVRYTVLAATLLAALGAVGIQTTSLLTIFASAGLAIGLALQGSLANFASGVMILFFRPFDLGDFIEAGGATGTVKDIGMFATTYMTPSNETIIVPNGAIMGGNITNYTRAGTRRAGISIGVAYGTSVKDAMETLERAAKKAELVLSDPAPAVALVGFGASSVDFKVLAWAEASDWLGMQHNVRVAIYNELEAAGIEIPFDQIVLHQADATAEAAAEEGSTQNA